MSALAFELPERLEAHAPPESRGLRRDEVQLLVARRAEGSIEHARFSELPSFLHAGDLLVVNTSATLAAAVDARRAGDADALELHFSTPAPGEGPAYWIVELRRAARPFSGLAAGERLTLPAGASAQLVARYAASGRLWLARLDLPPAPASVAEYLAVHGRPIRYGYVPEPWPLDAYQTAFALQPGSAEMPSAARPFTPELVTRLVSHGVLFAPVLLHTGVSSPERHEAPYPERYRVPAGTARLAGAVRAWGGRVIAVGTTAVRALESAADGEGTVHPGGGWTNLVITATRGLRAVDGLITGWHEPAASHLEILRAAAGEELLERSYDAALAGGYLWHEFGDSHLILP
jgi:S-adenosylmethionine:tRNA ribosyltransferase-isomerase